MANWNVHLDSGSVKVIYDAGYFVTKTEVIFYKKGQKRNKSNELARFKLSSLRPKKQGKQWEQK